MANRRAFIRELSRNLFYSEGNGTLSSVLYKKNLDVVFVVCTIRGADDARAALEAAGKAICAHKTGIRKEPV